MKLKSNQLNETQYTYCLIGNHTTSFYAPPTIVEGHYVFWSVGPLVRSFVRSSRFRSKFLVKVVFDEVEVQSN